MNQEQEAKLNEVYTFIQSLKNSATIPYDVDGALRDRLHDLKLDPINVKISENNVTNPPSEAEIITAFGTAITAGDGFIGVIDDNAGGSLLWLCVAINGKWSFEQLTVAS